MAKKRYRSLVEKTGDPRGEILVAGAGPGEEFEFDFDQPGYDEKALVDSGIIELVDKSKAKGD